jgi:hypothetical protein
MLPLSVQQPANVITMNAPTAGGKVPEVGKKGTDGKQPARENSTSSSIQETKEPVDAPCSPIHFPVMNTLGERKPIKDFEINQLFETDFPSTKWKERLCPRPEIGSTGVRALSQIPRILRSSGAREHQRRDVTSRNLRGTDINPVKSVETVAELESLEGRRDGKRFKGNRFTYTQMTVVSAGEFMEDAKTMWENHRDMGKKDCTCRTKLAKMLTHYQERWEDVEEGDVFPELKMMVTQEVVEAMEQFKLCHMEETVITYEPQNMREPGCMLLKDNWWKPVAARKHLRLW